MPLPLVFQVQMKVSARALAKSCLNRSSGLVTQASASRSAVAVPTDSSASAASLTR